MTKETIGLIIEWFAHIQQMATDRKTLTGAVMDFQHCLNEIAAIASNSKQYVEEYCNEQEPMEMWIDVKDKDVVLPSMSKVILVTDGHNPQLVTVEKFLETVDAPYNTWTHWMKIPKIEKQN